jgi:hypothetical protein
MATRLTRRVLPVAAMVMTMGASGLTLAGGFAQAGVAGGAGPAAGTVGVAPETQVAPAAPVATASQLPASVTPTTAPPITAPPTTSAPTPPAPPSSAASSPSPSSTSPSPSVSGSPTSGSGAFKLVYLWILIAVIVVIGLIAVISQVARGRTARRRAWRAQAVDAYTRGSGLFQSVQSATQASRYQDASAGARWADVQARAEDLTRVLSGLRGRAPGEYERARADDALNALDALRSASQAGDPAAAGRIQARLRDFEDALQSLRDPQ